MVSMMIQGSSTAEEGSEAVSYNVKYRTYKRPIEPEKYRFNFYKRDPDTPCYYSSMR